MIIETKYNLKDEVYTLDQTRTEVKCPLCEGEGVIIRNDKAYECGRCNSSGVVVSYSDYEYTVSENKVRIIGIKTSIGSGHLNIKYRARKMNTPNPKTENIREEMLFDNIEDAVAKCLELNSKESRK